MLPDDLLRDLSYLNLREIRAFCQRHGIPYQVVVEAPHGGTKPTADTDRKPVVLEPQRRARSRR
jgi:hypothetical protein